VPSDPLQGLIDDEKQAYEEWLEASDEPPLAYMPATRTGTELYSPSYHDKGADLLCHAPDLADLIELSGGDLRASRNVLNLSRPRVRDAVGEDCLVRPGDRVIVVTRGRNVETNLGEFVVEAEKAPCKHDPPFGLWADFEQPLAEDPLFATTDPTLKPGDNLFVRADQYPVAAASAETVARMKKLVPYPEDFRATMIDLQSAGLEALVLFERRTITLDDNGLPAVMAVAVSTAGVQVLWSERVDSRHGTGSLHFEGTLDLEGDGSPELAFTGVHRTCPYIVVFRRVEGAFEPVPLPVRPCGC
jgi:hypothetical protein